MVSMYPVQTEPTQTRARVLPRSQGGYCRGVVTVNNAGAAVSLPRGTMWVVQYDLPWSTMRVRSLRLF